MYKPNKPDIEPKMLTDVELELMLIIWKIGEGSTHDVLANLPPHRNLAYTSVSTILRILEQKGILEARKEGRGHIYIPILKKSDYEARAVKHVIEHVFDKTPTALVRQLIHSVKMDKEDILQIKEMLNKLETKK